MTWIDFHSGDAEAVTSVMQRGVAAVPVLPRLYRQMPPLVLYFFLILGSGITALADTGIAKYLPKETGPTPSGLRLFVDMYGVDGYGYRPVRVTVSTASGTASRTERSLRISLQPNGDYLKNVTTQVVTLPVNQVSATATILVPQTGVWETLEIMTAEDGTEYKDLSGRILDPRKMSYSANGPNILYINSDAYTATERASDLALGNVRKPVLVAPLGGLLNALNRNNFFSSEQFGDVSEESELAQLMMRQSAITSGDLVSLRPPAELSDNWLAYSAYSLIVVSFEDAAAVAKKQPEVWQAILSWVDTGGAVCVLGVKDEAAQAKLDKLLGRTSDRKKTWSPLRTRHRWTGNVDQYDGGYSGQDIYYELEPAPPIAEFDKPTFEQDLDDNILSLTRGFGTVISVQQNEPGLQNIVMSQWIFNFLDSGRWQDMESIDRLSWTHRHGMRPMVYTYEFWNFRVPGVGQAPVLLFCIMITIFAVAIGPVNYFTLARLGRLQWMLLTVPAGAALMIFCLFVYAIVADGFGHRIRSRSVTLLDQRTQTSTVWSRQVYFSGIAPSEGLEFPATTAVYPFKKVVPNQHNTDQPLTHHLLNWRDGQQQLARGYVSSRDTAQFLVVDAKTEDRRQVTFRSKGEKMLARNQLGVPLFGLFLTDEDGKHWWFRDVPVGGEVAGEAVVRNSLPQDATTFIQDQSVQEADGYFGGDRYENYFYDGYGYDRNIPFSKSILEEAIRWVNRDSVRPSRSYIAITQDPTGIPTGIKNGETRACLHFILGQY
jgi:hypothetical protein